jgi:putative transposase
MTTMTDDSMALLELAEKHGDGEFLKELEAEGQFGAERHERSPERVNRRNGYRDRQHTSGRCRVGT